MGGAYKIPLAYGSPFPLQIAIFRFFRGAQFVNPRVPNLWDTCVSLAGRKISIAISTLTAVITPVTYARLCNIAPQAPNFKIRNSGISKNSGPPQIGS